MNRVRCPAIAQMLQEEDIQEPQEILEDEAVCARQTIRPKDRGISTSRFDGVILKRGVLEMMPDGYGFLRSSDYNTSHPH